MERKPDADIFPTLTPSDMAQSAAPQPTPTAQPQQPRRSAAEALKQAKRTMVLVWVLTAVCAFLVFGRQAATGVKPTVLMYILLGVLLVCAIASTEGFIRYSLGKGRGKGKAASGNRRAKG